MTPPASTIAYGICRCGCGQMTTICPKDRPNRQLKKGEPYRWISGHQMRCPRVFMDDEKPFKIDGVYCRLIPLTQGYHTIVWESDYQWLTKWMWSAKKSINGMYARGSPKDGSDKKLVMARVILGMSDKDDRFADHINGCTLDNRRSNLRPATPQQSMYNVRGRRTNGGRGLKGACRSISKSNPWYAQIKVSKRVIYLGVFRTPEEAHEAYVEAAKKYHGEFARLE